MVLKRNFSHAVLTVAIVLAPMTAQAQTTDADAYFMSDEHRQKIYDQARKKPARAVLYNLALPGVGNFYAEQYVLGGIAIVLTAFAGTFIAYGLSTKQSDVTVLGGVVAGVAYGGSIATSLIGISTYNAKLRQGLKVDRASATPEFMFTPLALRF